MKTPKLKPLAVSQSASGYSRSSAKIAGQGTKKTSVKAPAVDLLTSHRQKRQGRVNTKYGQDNLNGPSMGAAVGASTTPME